MPIVLISEALLLRTTATDGRILRDRVLCGFGVRLNSRKRTFLIATSVSGKQFRMMLGHWPLMTVDEARSQAMDVLRLCRRGELPCTRIAPDLPLGFNRSMQYTKNRVSRRSVADEATTLVVKCAVTVLDGILNFHCAVQAFALLPRDTGSKLAGEDPTK